MSENTIKIQSFVTKSDYNVLRNYYMYKQKPQRTRFVVYLLLISIILLVLSQTAYSFSFFKPTGLLGGLVILALYSWISMDARKLEKAASQIVNKQQDMFLDESGLVVKWTHIEESTYLWSEIDQVVECDTHFFIFIDQYFVIILPKVELKEHRIKEIRRIISNHISIISDLSGWSPSGI